MTKRRWPAVIAWMVARFYYHKASWTDWRANMSPQSNAFWLLYLQNVYAVHIGNFTTIFGYNQSMLMINIWNGVHNTLLSGKYPLFIFSDMEVMILHICQIDTFYYEASCSTKLESKHAKTLLLWCMAYSCIIYAKCTSKYMNIAWHKYSLDSEPKCFLCHLSCKVCIVLYFINSYHLCVHMLWFITWH